MDKVFRVELTGNHRFYNLSLPATDYELLDALDRLGMTGQDKPNRAPQPAAASVPEIRKEEP